jgi:hypothetical protein
MPKPLTIVEFARSGGKARARKLTPAQRSEAARKAVEARWAKSRASLEKTIARVEKLVEKHKRHAPAKNPKSAHTLH